MKTKDAIQKAITDRDVAVAKPDSTLQDSKQPKLFLVVSPKGRKVWKFYGHVPALGMSTSKTLGPAASITVKEARDMVDAMKVDSAKGAPATKPGAMPVFDDVLVYAKPWVETWFTRYLDDWRHLRLDQLTQQMVEARERRILDEAGERQRLRDANGGNPERSNAGATSVSVVGKALRTCYKLATKKRGYTGSDMGEHMTFTKSEPRQRVFTLAEERRFFAALKSPSLSPWVEDFFTLLYETGVRIGNLKSARWSEVDIEGARWVIPAHKMKARKEHRPPLTPQAIAVLERMLEKRTDNNPWLFPGAKDKATHLTDTTHPWKLIKKLAELQGITQHDIRRTLGASLANAGVSLLVIKETLGHGSIRTTELFYSPVGEDAVREALARRIRA